MLRIGIIGLGFMGRMHLGQWFKMPGCQVVAVCDSNPDLFKTLDQAIGNVGGLPEKLDLSHLNFYTDLASMARQEKLDAVSITLPTWLHAGMVTQALELGLHVLCEKPMALDVEQCRQMVAATNRTGKHLMIAHCIRFWPEYAWLKQVLTSGQYGSLQAARFERVSARPAWSSGGWLADPHKSGGMVLDLHIHDVDFIQYLLGMPQAVACQCRGPAISTDHVETQFHYSDNRVVTALGSWLASDTYGFRMGFEAYLDKATIIYDCTQAPSLRVFPNTGEAITPQVSAGDGYYHEIAWFVTWIAGKPIEKIISPEQSMASIGLIEAVRRAAETGAIVTL